MHSILKSIIIHGYHHGNTLKLQMAAPTLDSMKHAHGKMSILIQEGNMNMISYITSLNRSLR